MADPHIKSKLDWLDHLTVIIYRLGFTFCFPIVALLPWNTGYPVQNWLFICAIMCASSLHIYLKSFRLLLQMATWIGLICVLLGYPEVGLGGAFITLGGLCFKEYFCFKIPGLPLQPFILAALWFSLQLDAELMAKVLAMVSAVLFLIVSIAKWRMPRHFDIGDKTKYQS
ncbi:DUF2301 domain-containing membrane protein [Vibrio sp. TH_r3]|uniref:DUF2301 domain-containing membrane protein n=1 Tax=Vibrio sp. TH_r3 TaxID=3082084 RepID=UPI00295488D1|nr:DUF2301 domain-containing membrane protein [Vibrio sp. TH_r3]MDV7103466.1 DUF2301 domain-containing membrane protein [Vibrio sp. TH_r3]